MRVEIGIGEDDAEHRRQLRAHHRRPLRHAEQRVSGATGGEGRAGELGTSVGGHHAAGGGDNRIGIVGELRRHQSQPLLDLRKGEKLPDHPSGEDEDGIGRSADLFASDGRHPLGIGQAPGSRAGVGVAGIDGDRPEALARRPRPVVDHRRRADEVRGVDAGRGGRAVGNHQRHVLTGRIPLQSGVDAGDAEALRERWNRETQRSFSDGHGGVPAGKRNGIGGRGRKAGRREEEAILRAEPDQSMPVDSGKPWRQLKFWTAAPDAPLTRLSRQLMRRTRPRTMRAVMSQKFVSTVSFVPGR